MAVLDIKPVGSCRYDLISLGEIIDINGGMYFA
jgi:hypothetical protein